MPNRPTTMLHNSWRRRSRRGQVTGDTGGRSSPTSGSIWPNYSDLTRPHPKWWFGKGNPLISGKPRLVKYYNLARSMGCVDLQTNFPSKNQPFMYVSVQPVPWICHGSMRTLKVDRPTYGHLRAPFLPKCLCLFIDKVFFFRILSYHGMKITTKTTTIGQEFVLWGFPTSQQANQRFFVSRI